MDDLGIFILENIEQIKIIKEKKIKLIIKKKKVKY